MEPWLKLSVWIGTFGFLKEFRPEDPYITQYLTGPHMNFTEEQVNQEIFPLATYISLVELIFVFLITDWLRYKPVVVVCALSGVITQIMLIWCRGLKSMQIMEFFYGTMCSTEVAYYTYIYAKVDKQYFQKVTSYMRGAILSGRFLSSVVSQVMLIGGFMTVAELNYLTLLGITLAFFWALTLPSAPRSLYFHRDDTIVVQNASHQNGNATLFDKEKKQAPSSCSYAIQFLWEDFKFAFTNTYVLKWCVWVALGTCGYSQVMSYVQILWETVNKGSGHADINNNNITIYNGAIEAVYTLISAFAAFSFGRIELDWKLHGESLVGIICLIQGCLLILSSISSSVIFCYLVYICFGSAYHIMMTVANSEIAKHIKEDSYALVFGVNTFISLLIQTIVTYTIASNEGFVLPIRTQFTFYGGYFVVLGLAYIIKCLCTYCHHYRRRTDLRDRGS